MMAQTRTLKEKDIKSLLKWARSDTKKLVIAGINGKVVEFARILAKYNFFGTLDSSMASIIIAFITCCIKSEDPDLKKFGLSAQRDGSLLNKMFDALIEGNGKKVKYYMGNYFQESLDKVLKKALPDDKDSNNKNKRAKIIKSFINQAGKITSWKINGKGISDIIDKLTNSKSFDLFYAAAHNDVNLAKLLLQNDADPNAKNNNKETALHVAAKVNNQDIIDLLLKNGANPNILNNENQTYTEVMYKKNPLKEMWKAKKEEMIKKMETRTGRPKKANERPLAEIVEEANEAYNELFDKYIDDEHKRFRLGSSDRIIYDISGGSSANFVRLYIRYLEQTYSDLKDYVKIFYCPLPNKDKYWNKLNELQNKSKKEGNIYFLVNQASLGIGWSYGHSNITIICNGNFKLFEPSVNIGLVLRLPGLPGGMKNLEKFREKGNLDGMVQRDEQNCFIISIGFVESLMKSLSKKRQDLVESIKNTSELKKELSKFLWDSMNKFTSAKTLPPNFIKYLQSRTSINATIANKKTPDEVKEKLKRTTEKYDLSNQPVRPFLNQLKNNTLYDCIEKYKISKNITINKCIEEFNSKLLDPSLDNHDKNKLKDVINMLEQLKQRNDRAQMKRRTEILKIKTLVDFLDKNKINIDDEMNKVNTFEIDKNNNT